MSLRHFLILFTALTFSICAKAQAPRFTAEEYIASYKDIAIEEMFRANIPASITLAQGILESGAGNSRLAKEGNNHFGIKCKGKWTGKTIYENDDDSNECFRAYPDVLESYKDHSNFLMKQSRYAFLFDLDITDYKGWAKGLKQAGYATNPNYPAELIAYIEKHHLEQFDNAEITSKQQQEIIVQKENTSKPERFFSINNTLAIKAKDGENYVSIALANDMRIWQIFKYNDLNDSSQIHVGDTIYLKPKRNKAEQDFCTFRKGDSMYKISQRYAVKLNQLLEKNKLNSGQEPLIGETIYLKHERDFAPTIQEKKIIQIPDTVKHEKPHPKIIDPMPPGPETKRDSMFTPDVKKPLITDSLPGQIKVKPGETLFRIAHNYQVNVDDLRKWNHMDSTRQIYVGQWLYISNPSNSNQPIKNPSKTILKTHTVKAGETLFHIAELYGLKVDHLKEINHLKGDALNIGQVLKLE